MKRRILLVDDEVAVLLTMKAVLEISGFDVETAASAREGKLRLRSHQYHMVITDMRMENDEAGREVIRAARTADYHPAVALLTAFPVDESDWQELGADQLLLKPMHTRVLLEQIEKLFVAHEKRLAQRASGSDSTQTSPAKTAAAKKTLPDVKGSASNTVKGAASKVAKGAAGKTPPSKPTKKSAAKTSAPNKRLTPAKKAVGVVKTAKKAAKRSNR